MIQKLKYFWIAVSILTACGCGSSGEGPIAQKLHPPTMGKTLTPQTALPPSTGPSALPAKSEPYYDPTGKPDPFQPPVLENSGDQKSRRARGLPLQQFEVTEFELVGIVSADGRKSGLNPGCLRKRVLDQGGDSHRQKPGPGGGYCGSTNSDDRKN